MGRASRRLSTAVVASILGVGCHPGGVTPSRIEGAVGPTFANLVHAQLSVMGLPTLPASALRVTTSCYKVGVGAGTTGAGEWICNLVWFGPDKHSPGRESRLPLHDVYDLSVGSDGCYTATADVSEAHVGGPTLMTADGSTVTNLLFMFDGCFDTT